MTTPREIVFDAIQHRQPVEVPYTLGFESEVDRPLNADSDVEARLDDYYSGPHWRKRSVSSRRLPTAWTLCPIGILLPNSCSARR